MNAPVLTFFNNKAGVGKTSLVYHLAWMFSSLGKRVVVVDADPQANLSSLLLDDDTLAALWDRRHAGTTIHRCIEALAGAAALVQPVLQRITPELYLLPGDINLSACEDALSAAWCDSMGEHQRDGPMHVLSAFGQLMEMASGTVQADLVLVDTGPNLGAINRSVLIASDYVAIPLACDLLSLASLESLGPTLRHWKNSWHQRLGNWHARSENTRANDVTPPHRKMQPIGYTRQQYSIRLERPVSIVDQWAQALPGAYRTFVLNQPILAAMPQDDDRDCLATMKHYRSLRQIAHERRKPIFQLTSADGAIGSHAGAVQDAKKDFTQLAKRIAERIDLDL
jgi:chromosome partitioning protein